VAIGRDEDEIASVKVRATSRQVEQLMCWAEPFEKRTWAIESVGGLGYLLAQQLVAQGEEVLDVPATLASRIRVLATGRSNKNDPNDAHSIAIAALRAPALRSVEPADHGEVLRLLSKRNSDLGRQRARVICRQHSLFAELSPGGIAKEMYCGLNYGSEGWGFESLRARLLAICGAPLARLNSHPPSRRTDAAEREPEDLRC
jgi:transposase